jgi:methanogenic corrinoid protein MtbC1
MRKSDKAEKKKVLCIPLDPVHDFGLRMIKKKLDDAGHHTKLLPPDLSIEEISEKISRMPNFDFILVSRTIGYGSAEILANFLDVLDALRIRDYSRASPCLR